MGVKLLKRNLIANYLGQGWSALMGLAFIPVYIKYLSIESYGLIGLFAAIQAWLIMLDMGMTPALSREMARFTAGTHTAQSIRDLLRSVEFVALGVAIVIALSIWTASDWLASDWLKAENLSTGTVAYAFTVMGIVSALRFVEGIYRSSIVGLQRQVLLNVLNSTMATLRSVGAATILIWISPTIKAFFLWQAAVSMLTLLLFAWATYRSMPKVARGARFSVQALKSIMKFAGGMMGITFLSLLLVQVDKILLSKLLSLYDYGYYMLGATVAGALYMVINPIGQAWFPRLTELHARKDQLGFIASYHQGAQLVSVTLGSMAAILIVFSGEILNLWTQDPELASRTAKLVSLLALGNLFNGLMWIPYQAQLANGWTGLATRINILAVLIIVPAIIWAVPLYGAEGAAWAWVCLNAAYVLIAVHFMYSKILQTEKWSWYINDVIQPLTTVAIVSLVLHHLMPISMSGPIMMVFLCGAGVVVMFSAGIAAPLVRLWMITQIKKWRLSK